MHTRVLLAAIVTGSAVLACVLPPVFPAQDQAPPAIPSAAAQTLLPHSLYYLSSGSNGYTQVWRMEADGSAQSQITFEPDNVQDFDVSRGDGGVVYVVNNQLYWVDAHGANRRLLADGGPIVDSTDFRYHGRITSPLWSPDGTVIAFGWDGLVFYEFGSGTLSHPVKNEVQSLEDGTVLPTKLLEPEAWSPDGMKLIFTVGSYEGGAAGIFDLARVGSIQFNAGPMCCFVSWSPDSRSILMASPYDEYTEPGLWRYDANTGVGVPLLDGGSDVTGYHLVSYPLVTEAGELYFFFTETGNPGQSNREMLLVRSTIADPQAMVPIWDEALQVYEALWAPDGTSVLLVQPFGDKVDFPYRGSVLMISFNRNEGRTILVDGFNLRWGP